MYFLDRSLEPSFIEAKLKMGALLILAMITSSCATYAENDVTEPIDGGISEEVVVKSSLSEEAQAALDLVASELGSGAREAAFIEMVVYERETDEITEFTIIDQGLVKRAEFPIDLGRLKAVASIEQSVEIDLIGSHCKLKHGAGGPYWTPSTSCPD